MKKKISIFIPGFPPSMHKFAEMKQVAQAYLKNADSFQLIEKIDKQQPEPWIILALDIGTPNAMRQAMMKVYWPLLDLARSQASLMTRSELFYDKFDGWLLDILATEVPEHIPGVVEIPLESEERHALLNAIHTVARGYEDRWDAAVERRERQQHGGRGRKPLPPEVRARRAERSQRDRMETAKRKGKKG